MRTPAALLALAILLLATAPLPVADARTTTLDQRIEARLRKANLRADRYGIVVFTREQRPRILFARGHTQALVPASTAKVLTAAAVLDLLGPAHTFTTTVTARGRVHDGVLEGDLVVHGTGDPNVSGRLYGGRPIYVLEGFAQAVRKAGIRHVTGSVVLDDGPFDRCYVHSTWSAGDRARWYGAPVAGLSFNDSCADIRVQGAASGGAPALVTAPSTTADWRLENRVKTTDKGRTTVGGHWARGCTTLRVQGTIPKGVTYTFSHPVPDPLRFFAGAFMEVLKETGVRVEGVARPARDAADRTPGDLRLARHGSAVSTSLQVMNRRSQNFYAALLFKAAGARHTGCGTWASGQAAVGDMLRRRGLDPDGKTRIVDGSGLSLGNRTTAATLARLIHAFDRDLLRGPTLIDSLAVPGEEGTLRRRLRAIGKRLHAKTGTLGSRGVHALAGTIDGVEGEKGLVFAILLNGVPSGRSLIDDLVSEMARR